MAQQSNPIEMYESAAQGFRQRLSGVQSNQMSSPTPCTEWDVQALINHNINATGFAEGVYRGNVTVNPQDVSGPLPGVNALEALDAGIAKVVDAVKASGSLDEQIDTPFGPMTRGAFLIDMACDLLVHTWDLAKGTNQNTTLDSGLVDVMYHAFAPQMDGMRQMEFEGIKPMGPEVSVPASASLQDRFIGMMGRQP